MIRLVNRHAWCRAMNKLGVRIRPYPLGRILFASFQAINCLATIISSLQDKRLCPLALTRRPYPQLNRSNADIHALGVVPKVSRKRATNAPGCR